MSGVSMSESEAQSQLKPGASYGSTDMSPQENAESSTPEDTCCPKCCPAPSNNNCFMYRYFTAVMICLGFVILIGYRCNVSAATVYFREMYNSSLNASEKNLQWNPLVVGWVDSCVFLGFLLTHIPGGMLAAKYPATAVFSIAIGAGSVLNLLLPLAFNTHFGLVIAIRILQGMFEGCTFPAFQGILRHWAPPLDRSRLTTIALDGQYAGVALGLLMSGLLSDHFGWPTPFYVYGAAGIAWFGAWQVWVYEKPSTHPRISPEERRYIEESIGESMDVREKFADLPWRKIFTSMPIYAITVASFARKWSSNMILFESYKFFNDVFKFDMTKNGILSALPHVIVAFVIPIGGQMADCMRRRGVSTTIVRKLFNSLGFGLEAVFLLGVGFTTDAATAVVCLCLAVGCVGLGASGFTSNLLDIAPRYVSILWGLIYTVTLAGSAVVPVVTVEMVADHSHKSWSHVFLISTAILTASVVFFAIFASGEQQSWATASSGKANETSCETLTESAEQKLPFTDVRSSELQAMGADK